MARKAVVRGALFAVMCAAAAPVGCGGKVAQPVEEHLGTTEQRVSGDCTAAFAGFTPSAGQPTPANGAVVLASPAQCIGGQNAEYRFSATAPSGASVSLCDWAPATQCKWAGAAMTERGRWTVKLETRRAGTTGVDGSTAQRYAVGAVCNSVGITTVSPGSGPVGTNVSVSVGANCDAGAGAQVALFAVAPDGATTQVGAWQSGTSGSFTWNTTGARPGRFTLRAAAKRGDVSASGYAEATGTQEYLLGQVCDRPSVVISGSGTDRTVTVTAACTSGAAAEVKLTQLSPSGVATLLQDFAPASPFVWHTAGLVGTWRIKAEVRAAASPTQYLGASTRSQALAGACTSVTLGGLPTWTMVGTGVPLSASVAGCASPELMFRVRPNLPGAGWRNVSAAWIAGTSTSWATSGYSAGQYEVTALARLAGSTDIPFEAESASGFTGIDADADGDGHKVSAGDCNDQSAAAHPGAAEVCNAADDNCNGTVDDGLPLTTYFADLDGDGFGAGAGTMSCGTLPGLVANASDCDDGSAAIHPGAAEVCGNAIDENCDGSAPSCRPAGLRMWAGSSFNPTCLSRDGNYVGGSFSSSSGTAAAVLDRSSTVTPLPAYDTTSFTPSETAYALSADGTMVLGYSSGSSLPARQIVLWNRTGGAPVVVRRNVGAAGWPAAISDDGNTVVGFEGGFGSFKFDVATSTATAIGTSTFRASAANADASIVFGGPYKWTASGGQVLVLPTGGYGMTASNAAGDAGAVTAVSGSVNSAYRWRASSGTSPLVASGFGSRGTVPKGTPVWVVDSVQTTAISANGDTVVGAAVVHDAAGWVSGSFNVALVWDKFGNAMSVDAAAGPLAPAVAFGQQWSFWSAVGVSADGKTIAGQGVNDSGSTVTYILDLP